MRTHYRAGIYVTFDNRLGDHTKRRIVMSSTSSCTDPRGLPRPRVRLATSTALGDGRLFARRGDRTARPRASICRGRLAAVLMVVLSSSVRALSTAALANLTPGARRFSDARFVSVDYLIPKQVVTAHLESGVDVAETVRDARGLRGGLRISYEQHVVDARPGRFGPLPPPDRLSLATALKRYLSRGGQPKRGWRLLLEDVEKTLTVSKRPMS